MFQLKQSAFAPIEQIDFPNRWFEIWTYYKGHGQLILRSPRFRSVYEPTFPTRVDVLFKNVHGLKLPADVHGLTVSIADPTTADRIAGEIDSRVHLDQTVFLVSGSHYSGYVLAGSVTMTEDEGDDSAPSALMPYVRTVLELDPIGRSKPSIATSARRGRRRVDRTRHHPQASRSRLGGHSSSHRTDVYDIEKLTVGARRLGERGATIDEVLTYLRQSGASPIASVQVLREMTCMAVSEAKSIVWNSQTWADRRVGQENFIAAAEKVRNDAHQTEPESTPENSTDT